MSIGTRPLGPEERTRLAELADVMLPATDRMPAASGADDGRHLDAVLAARPDLIDGLRRAIVAFDEGTFDLPKLESYLDTDQAAYVALTTVVAATYYQSDSVRELIGYPGQVAKAYDPYAYVEWVEAGLLDTVVERGPIWRDPRPSRPASEGDQQ